MTWARNDHVVAGRLTWWVAVLFMVGSTLFALGSFPLYAQWVAPAVVGVTFFLGSLFFTSAATGQLVASGRFPTPSAARSDRLGWWASLVQLVGTLLFNISTFAAMITSLDVQEVNQLVWRPDVYGSVAFLVASHLAWLAVCGRLWAVRRDDVNWWIAVVNYLGSIFFMASAIAAWTLPSTGQMVNVTIVNLATFMGAIGFLLGAWLLLPPRAASHARPPASVEQ